VRPAGATPADVELPTDLWGTERRYMVGPLAAMAGAIGPIAVGWRGNPAGGDVDDGGVRALEWTSDRRCDE
jgi:hypothetical protein